MKQGTRRKHLSGLLDKVKSITPKDTKINIMEVCGTHTMEIGRSGLRQLLPENIRLVSGPGCPVCVTHDAEIEAYLNLAEREDVLIATFGDLMRVPGKGGSLVEAKSRGANINLVYSTLDALKIARKNPDKEVVFLGAGFETTTPTIAMSVIEAREANLNNYSVFSMHKLVPPALDALLADSGVNIDGFLYPGHVSAIIGLEPYRFVVEKYHKAGVVTGFETHDILEGIEMLLEQIVGENPGVAVQYKRAVKPEGNPKAREVMYRVFEPVDALWRGIGLIPESGLEFNSEYENYNAKLKFNIDVFSNFTEQTNQHCACGDILKGIKIPTECRIFGRGCTPANPVGPCMVSSEGACAAYYKYGEGEVK